MTTILEILRQARASLDELGWCQHSSWRDKDGHPTNDASDVDSCCARGAIILSVHLLTNPHGSSRLLSYSPDLPLIVWASARLREQLRDSPGDSHHSSSIVDWNDARGRTKDEVLAAFDRALAATLEKDDTSKTKEGR